MSYTFLGVESVEPDLETQRVKVLWGGTDPNILLIALQKWGSAAGKTVELLEMGDSATL